MEARPLLGVPVLRPHEPLERLVRSVAGAARIVIIDNSQGRIDWEAARVDGWLPKDVHITKPYSNLGCAGAWNAIMRGAVNEPYWLTANADATLSPGDIDYVVGEMEKGGPRWVGICGDWRLMGLTREAVETVGWFDESFHPIYCEDADYERRCNIAGVPWYNSERRMSNRDNQSTAKHVGGTSWKGTRLETENKRTYRENRTYYQAKWGTGPRGSGGFDSPFGSGTPDKCGPDIARLRSQSWKL